MRIKYGPQKADHDTTIKYIDEDAINYNGEEHRFDPSAVDYPDIAKETDYKILEAHRDNCELYLTVLRQYTGSCSEWDDGQYHEVTA